MKKDNPMKRLFRFYREGFATMTIDRTLWLVVIVKLVVIFLVLRLFFLPNTLKNKAAPGHEADYIEQQITGSGSDDKAE